MNIFICWSGPRGKRAAEALSAWLSDVFGSYVEPRASYAIEKGVNWFDGLQQFLDASSAGLLCLTPEAIRSPWVNYEAGVLSRALRGARPCPDGGLTGRLFTFLWGVSGSELTGPLAAFQSTLAQEQRDVRQLVDGLLMAMPADARPGHDWVLALDERWPALWESLKARLEVIPTATLTEVCPKFEGLFRRKTFEEPTSQCVDQRWLDRYVGAREALRAIRESRGLVEHACRGYIVDLYRSLESELDGYAMAISLLVTSPRFALNQHGSLEIDPPGLLVACESRRRRVRQLVARMIDPAEAPFFSEARRFDEQEEFAERKNLVHRMTPKTLAFAELQPNLAQMWPCDAFCFSLVFSAFASNLRPPPSDRGRDIELRTRWRTSEWDFDRVMYAIYLEQRLRLHADVETFSEGLVLAEAEFEKTRARQAAASLSASLPNKNASMMPMYYALGPLTHAHGTKLDDQDVKRIRVLTDHIGKFIDARGTVDEPVRATLQEIDRKLNASSRDATHGQASSRSSHGRA